MVVAAAGLANEVSVEAQVVPANLYQNGPAYMIRLGNSSTGGGRLQTKPGLHAPALNGVGVANTELDAANGTAHEIDGVLTP